MRPDPPNEEITNGAPENREGTLPNVRVSLSVPVNAGQAIDSWSIPSGAVEYEVAEDGTILLRILPTGVSSGAELGLQPLNQSQLAGDNFGSPPLHRQERGAAPHAHADAHADAGAADAQCEEDVEQRRSTGAGATAAVAHTTSTGVELTAADGRRAEASAGEGRSGRNAAAGDGAVVEQRSDHQETKGKEERRDEEGDRGEKTKESKLSKGAPHGAAVELQKVVGCDDNPKTDARLPQRRGADKRPLSTTDAGCDDDEEPCAKKAK